MARGTPLHPARTALGVAVRNRRSGVSQENAADDAGVPRGTLSRIERGTHRPTYDTAKALAIWLGWTIEQVMEASGVPAASTGSPDDALDRP